MKENYTHITFLMDRSGSMSSIRNAIQESFNQLVKDQAAIDLPCTLSLYDFDAAAAQEFLGLSFSVPLIGEKDTNGFSTIYEMTQPKDAPEYALKPRGYTALNDAMAQAINRTGELLAALDESERPSKVLIIILTDGHENASRLFTAEQVKAMIEHQRNTYNWEFSFIGANIDAILTAQQYSINEVTQFQATAASSRGLMEEHSKSIRAYRTNAGLNYTAPSNIDSNGSVS